jgi:hypothetical protein
VSGPRRTVGVRAAQDAVWGTRDAVNGIPHVVDTAARYRQPRAGSRWLSTRSPAARIISWPGQRRPAEPACMTQNRQAGDHPPRNCAPQPAGRRRIRVGSPGDILAVVPLLLGFHPSGSIVVLGITGRGRQVSLAFRYDLPDPPDARLSAEIAAHAVTVLARQHIAAAIVIGYGPGALVTPVADRIGQRLRAARIETLDVLRVQDARYWSYLCRDPRCCPADGVPFDPAGHPAALALAATEPAPAASREELAATLAPVTGPAAQAMRTKTRKAQLAAVRRISRDGRAGLHEAGRRAVKAALARYRADPQVVLSDWQCAWLSVVLAELAVRDDAWARMDPEHVAAHQRLWTHVVRRAQPGYVAAPAALLAFIAWQGGQGTLANIAIDRALADMPGYSMAVLIGEAVSTGAPPSVARLPMTPEEVAASYAERDGQDADGQPGS